MMEIDGIKYYCDKEISSKYGLSVPWLKMARHTGKTPPYYKFIKKVLYKIEDVDKWLKENLQSKSP